MRPRGATIPGTRAARGRVVWAGSISAVLAALVLWTAPPARAGGIEPFLARLADDPISKSPGSVSPVFAWDEAEASMRRARVLIRKTEGAGFSTIRSQVVIASPESVWEGDCGDIAQLVAPWADLRRIAEIPGVSYLFRSPRPIPCRQVLSEGIDTIRVPAFHAAGPRGAGSRIAILDIGFLDYERYVGNELGDDVVARSFFRSPAGRGDITGSGDPDTRKHGVACAEIIHDIAPDARLYLVNVETLADLQAAVNWLVAEHVSVISHSVGWYFGGLNGRGPINEIADRASNNDVLWVNAAGNEAERHTWTTAIDTDADQLIEFDGEGDETLAFSPVDALDLVLLWDDWPRSRDAAFDLELVDSEGSLLASTEGQDVGNPYAFRQLLWEAPQSEPVAFRVRGSGDFAGLTLHVFRIGHGVTIEEHRGVDRSLLVPADSPAVLAVGAVYWRNLTLDSYSSRGELGGSGTAKPELCAPVAVSTAVYGSGGFRGTSAAAPHVAGAAGLLASAGIHGGYYDVQWTRGEVISLLSAHARPLPDVEPLGWGCLRLPVPESGSSRPGLRLSRNPAFGRVHWSAGSGTIDVMDIAGRIVARCPEPFWDGRDADGRPVGPGVYFMRSPQTGVTTRLVWLGR